RGQVPMRSRCRAPSRPVRLSAEYLEDRTNPTGLVDPFAANLSVVDAPADRVNVVTAGGAASPATLPRLAASPYAAAVQPVGFGIYTVGLARGVALADAVAYFDALPGVTAAEPDYTVRADLTPNDTQYPSLYAMPKISAPAAWDVNTGSGNFVVAVIDTG